MIVAIASGKGGTGKTTLAVNLAAAMGDGVTYVDCDVEEPNGHLFLKPVIETSKTVGIPAPVVDKEACTGCGRCVKACRFNALACVKGQVLVFGQLCHGCGGCRWVCPERAITEQDRPIGVVETGRADGVAFIQGRLNVGATMSPPLIRTVRNAAPSAGVVILDAPPGTSCPVIAAMRGVDFVVLVTEPTPFGLHDLTLAVDTVRKMEIPFGVVVNRCDVGDNRVSEYCAKEAIAILAEIPDDRRVAEAYSRGEMVIHAVPGILPVFEALAASIRGCVDERASKGGQV
jgi:MinD superfamily P-loop ATPase